VNSARPLLDGTAASQLREVVDRDFGSAAVAEVLGLAGEAALSRGDLAGVARLTRGGSPTETLIRLFLLGLPAAESAIEQAMRPLSLADAIAAGLLVGDGAEIRAGLDLRPYAESGGRDWWVVSDLAADVRPGVLDAEHVLGIGAAATTLAQSTMRQPVRKALDVGTGCGIQALHLSRHSEHVTATDLSPRALNLAATTAALNELSWDLRQGSLLDPVIGEEYELIVSNPPFIVGPGFAPGAGGFRYRDSGMAGDAVCAELIRGIPRHLAPGGSAQLLANWQIGLDEAWTDRLQSWLDGSGCDAWIWQRQVADPGEYVALWLRDAGEVPATASWMRRYDSWLNWFSDCSVAAVGMGLVNIRRTGSRRPTVVCEDVVQAVEQPIGSEIASWFDRTAWLNALTDDALLASTVTAVPDLVQAQQSVLSADGWQPALTQLRQSRGMRWEIEIDQAVAALVAASQAALPLTVVLSLIAASLGESEPAVSDALLPVVRDLVQRGVLLPAGDG
jgi:methylase of polypeptide subunit release factors